MSAKMALAEGQFFSKLIKEKEPLLRKFTGSTVCGWLAGTEFLGQGSVIEVADKFSGEYVARVATASREDVKSAFVAGNMREE